MTARDQLVAISLAVLAVLGAVWMLVVSPEQKKAVSLAAQVATARSQLASAQGTAASARTAEAQYTEAYASIVSLGKAVPISREVPSLIYQITQAANEKNVEFTSISASASAPSSSSSASAQGAASSGFSTVPFTFVFNGTFANLERLFEQLDGSVVQTSSGGLKVSGRLLTVQSVTLAPSAAAASAGSSSASSQKLTGTISATAYVLPPGEGLTGGATPASPAGATAPASSSSSASSPTAPALARVNP